MIDVQSSRRRRIPIDSVIVTADRTRKDFGDIDSLADSISSVGLMQPIVVNENNELVDGQRRIKAYIQLGRTEIPFYQVSLEQIVLGEFHANSNRKDFTSSERVAISNAVEKYLHVHSRGVGRPRANKNVATNTTIICNACASDSKNIETNSSLNNGGVDKKNNVVNLTTFSGRLKDNVSRYFGISRNTLEKEKKLIKAAEQNPESFGELKQKVDQKKISIDKAFNEIQKQAKKTQISASVRNSGNTPPSLGNITLLHGDFREQSRTIPNGSIDLIFTDPPYAREYIHLYNDLAVVAKNVLGDGSSLVTYVGHYVIPEVIEIMRSVGLTYWWPIAIILSGSFAKCYPRHVSIKWKPLLWFVKGDKLCTTDFLSDVIKSDTPSKELHEWEQSTIEAEHVISRLSVEGQTVFDPMMGSGTSVVAAIKLGRRFIGIEIDSDKFEVAKARIGNVSRINRNEGKCQEAMARCHKKAEGND
jgi:16S rRNA G966 N2-methylase RsmD